MAAPTDTALPLAGQPPAVTDVPFPDPETRHPLDADCARCPALVDSRECISWGQGDPDADVMVVGEAPGAGDSAAETWRGGNYTGMAYTTRNSGRKVRTLLADAGVDPADAYFTNAVKCHPEGNRDPTPEERANCRGHLETELRRVDPDVVLATGKTATASLLAFDGREVDGFVDTVLDPVESAALEVTVVPLLHPSYQEIWLGRLGYDYEAYVAALRGFVPGGHK